MKLWQQPCVAVTFEDGTELVMGFEGHRQRGQFVQALLSNQKPTGFRYFFRPAPAAIPEQAAA